QTVQLGQSARVYVGNGNRGAASVPLSALQPGEGGGHAVWVVDPAGPTVRLKPIEAGPPGEARVPVQSGLDADDWVVVAGGHLLREGQQISPVDRDNRPVAMPQPAGRSPMRFNLSEWALRNRGLVLYSMIVVAIGGVLSYLDLARSEDPPFTFKAMVVRTLWPGATAEEVSRQVTERIEKKLLQTCEYEFIRSHSRPGEAQVIFMARGAMRSRDVPELWYQVRKKVGDIRATLPEGVIGPFFNDEFGDTFGN